MQKEYFGFGSIENLRDILKSNNYKNIFLVTGKKSYETSGAKSALENILSKYHKTAFSDFSSSPQIQEIEKGFALFEKDRYDIIMAVGGGSVIDTAKSIKLFSYEKVNRKIPLIAIPTTSGSGSESTYFIVYYKDKEKQSKGNFNITLPDYAILDPSLTLSLPKKITASTGLDALSQAIESYWSINSTEKSKNYSKEAISLILKNLELTINNPTRESRAKMMRAANLAGKAINITKTTASHAISYPITSHFNIPHGHAVALTLPEILVYNSQVSKKDCLDNRGQEYARKTIKEICNLLKAETPEQARDKLINLIQSVGLETKLSDLGISDFEIIIEKGFAPERVKNNPRLLTEENLREILDNIK